MLENIALFSGLAQAELDAIAAHASTKTYKKNTIIIDKGDETSSLYVIISGRVKVFIADDQGKELVLGMLGPDDYFGELATLGDCPRTASVMTMEPSRVAIISRRDFQDCLGSHPHIAFNLIKALVSRVRGLTERMGDLALLDVYGRVARVLLDNAVEEDGKLVAGRLTQQEIANMVGASREMVSRILKDLRSGGYIETTSKAITINKKLPPRW